MKVAHLSEPAEEHVVFRDGLGVRERRETSPGEVTEWFHLDPAFAAAEAPLRERVTRLAKLQHVKFARIFSLEPAGRGTGPILVSSHVPGTRFSEVLEMAGHGLLTFEPGAGLQVTREVLAGLAVLHDSRNVAHGALAPERVVLTAPGRVVMVEHVLAQALDRLQRQRHQLWREWRIPTPPAAGPVRMDMQTDLAQAGLLALAALLGRPLGEEEYPHRLRGLLPLVQDRLARSPAASIGADVVAWLERLAPVDSRRAFKTVREAQQALEALMSGGAAALGISPARVKGVMSAVAAISAAKPAAAEEAPAAPEPIVVASTSASEVVEAIEPAPALAAPAPAAATTTDDAEIDIEALLRLEAELEGGASVEEPTAGSAQSAKSGRGRPSRAKASPSKSHVTASDDDHALDEIAEERVTLERQFAELVASVAPADDAPVHLIPETPPTSEPLVDARVRWSSMPADDLSDLTDAPVNGAEALVAATENVVAATPEFPAADVASFATATDDALARVDASNGIAAGDRAVVLDEPVVPATPEPVAFAVAEPAVPAVTDVVSGEPSIAIEVEPALAVAMEPLVVPPLEQPTQVAAIEHVPAEWWREALPWRDGDADAAAPAVDVDASSTAEQPEIAEPVAEAVADAELATAASDIVEPSSDADAIDAAAGWDSRPYLSDPAPLGEEAVTPVVSSDIVVPSGDGDAIDAAAGWASRSYLSDPAPLGEEAVTPVVSSDIVVPSGDGDAIDAAAGWDSRPSLSDLAPLGEEAVTPVVSSDIVVPSGDADAIGAAAGWDSRPSLSDLAPLGEEAVTPVVSSDIVVPSGDGDAIDAAAGWDSRPYPSDPAPNVEPLDEVAAIASNCDSEPSIELADDTPAAVPTDAVVAFAAVEVSPDATDHEAVAADVPVVVEGEHDDALVVVNVEDSESVRVDSSIEYVAAAATGAEDTIASVNETAPSVHAESQWEYLERVELLPTVEAQAPWEAESAQASPMPVVEPDIAHTSAPADVTLGADQALEPNGASRFFGEFSPIGLRDEPDAELATDAWGELPRADEASITAASLLSHDTKGTDAADWRHALLGGRVAQESVDADSWAPRAGLFEDRTSESSDASAWTAEDVAVDQPVTVGSEAPTDSDVPAAAAETSVVDDVPVQFEIPAQQAQHDVAEYRDEAITISPAVFVDDAGLFGLGESDAPADTGVATLFAQEAAPADVEPTLVDADVALESTEQLAQVESAQPIAAASAEPIEQPVFDVAEVEPVVEAVPARVEEPPVAAVSPTEELVPEVVVVDEDTDGDALNALPSEEPASVEGLQEDALAEAVPVAASTSGSKRKKKRSRRKKSGAANAQPEPLPVQDVAPAAPPVVVPEPVVATPDLVVAAPVDTPEAFEAPVERPSAAAARRSLLEREVPTWTPPADLGSLSSRTERLPAVRSSAPPSIVEVVVDHDEHHAAPAVVAGPAAAPAEPPPAPRPVPVAISAPTTVTPLANTPPSEPWGTSAAVAASDAYRPFEQEIRAVGMPDLEELGVRTGRATITSMADNVGVSHGASTSRQVSIEPRVSVPGPEPSRGFNWRRFVAASVLIALFQGAAFAAWWWVQPGAQGTLVVQTSKVGVEVLLDDQVVGRTPFREEVKPGRHKLTLRQGTTVREMPVEISVGVVTTQAINWPSLSGGRGNLQVTSNPAGAEIFINGKSRGTAPQLLEDLPAGDQQLTLRSDAGAVTITTTVVPDETTPVEVKIFAGWILVDAPVEVNLLLNGRNKIGSSMDGQILLPPGTHRVQAVNEGLGIRQWFTVTVEPGAVSRVPFTVAPGQLTLAEEAEVFVDGTPIGTTPGTLTIQPGTHEILIRPANGPERRQAMTVRSKQSIEF